MTAKHSKITTCSKSLKLLGDYWTLRILETLSSREMRYCELQRATDNVNPVTLTNRLLKLERAGLVYRAAEAEDKISVSYGLSELGLRALPVLSAIGGFSRAYTKSH